MTLPRFHPGPGEHAVVITRVARRHWHALEDDLVVGRGETSRRPDGRLFLSVDAWRAAVFDRLAETMLAALPRPLHTVVDEADADLLHRWRRAGFTTRRREREYLLPADPQAVRPRSALPSDVSLVRLGRVHEDPLRELDRVVRTEIDATGCAVELPADVLPRPPGVTVVDPSAYAAAARSAEYVGLVRVSSTRRRARIGLIAVRADQRRRGIARALLGHVLDELHRGGTAVAAVDVPEPNPAATALLEGAGATAPSANLELVLCRGNGAA